MGTLRVNERFAAGIALPNVLSNLFRGVRGVHDGEPRQEVVSCLAGLPQERRGPLKVVDVTSRYV